MDLREQFMTNVDKKMINQQKYFFWGGLIVILFIISYPISYVIVLTSEPYQYVQKELMASDVIIKKIGTIKKVNLDFFGYVLKSDGAEKSADFQITVVGVKGKAEVNTKLKTKLGEWEIVGLRIHDKEN